MSNLIFLIAPPCHGKTTYRENNFKNSYIISRDDIRENVIEKYNVSYADLFAKPGENEKIDLLVSKIENDYLSSIFNAKNALDNGQDVVIDLAKLMTQKDRDDISNKILGNSSKHNKIAIIFEANNKIVEKLNKKRGDETGKVIPFQVIENIKKQFEPINDNEGFVEIKKIKSFKKLSNKFNY